MVITIQLPRTRIGGDSGKCQWPFVLINADLGAEEQLVKDLKSTENVKDVYVVYGVYDIVARIEGETMEKVKETITWKIRRLDRVRSTLTMIVVEG
jgi:DNA-binding Lrp family transcriptional regulator